MHYFQFHIGDYKSHTHHLSHMEDLAYRRLLDFYYLHEQPIKQREIARQIGMKDNEQDVLTVLNEFFLSTDDGFVNPRADKEIKAFREHQAKSAYGAFIRDNPDLKKYVDKDKFISAYSLNKHGDYITSLSRDHVPMMGTSSPHDATNTQYPIPNNQDKKTVATKVARPKSVDKQVWDDWLAIRRAKKLPLTETAWKQLMEEIDKSGFSVDVVIKECCLRGWGAFKVAWLKDNPISISPSQAFAGDI